MVLNISPFAVSSLVPSISSHSPSFLLFISHSLRLFSLSFFFLSISHSLCLHPFVYLSESLPTSVFLPACLPTVYLPLSFSLSPYLCLSTSLPPNSIPTPLILSLPTSVYLPPSLPPNLTPTPLILSINITNEISKCMQVKNAQTINLPVLFNMNYFPLSYQTQDVLWIFIKTFTQTIFHTRMDSAMLPPYYLTHAHGATPQE